MLDMQASCADTRVVSFQNLGFPHSSHQMKRLFIGVTLELVYQMLQYSREIYECILIWTRLSYLRVIHIYLSLMRMKSSKNALLYVWDRIP